MTDQQKIKDEIEQYQMFLEESITEEPESAFAKGNELVIIIARTGYLLADAKKTLNEKIQSSLFDELKKLVSEYPYPSARILNTLIDSICREERFMVDWIERVNKSATHQLEYIRTIISYAKQEKFSTRQFNT